MTLNRAAAPMRILQFGEGNFLRTFFDWMVDRMQKQAGYDGCVGLVKTIPGPFSPDFQRQDNVYTAVIRGRDGGRVVQERTRIEVIADRFNPYEDFAGYLAAGCDPEVQVIVSNTTEAGIVLAATDGPLDRPAPSFPGKLAQLLRARFLALGGGPDSALLVLPCELIERNGATLREYVLDHARRWYRDPAFEAWIARRCTFVDTLVDRIVSGHDPEARRTLCQETGFDDALLSVGEPYHLLAGLNAVWTDDVTPYRALKVRILNGGHTFLAMVGPALGVGHVRACLEHPLLRRALEQLYQAEIIPALPLPEAQGVAYARTILDRFDNPFMVHALQSIALNSVAKWRARLLPSAVDFARHRGGAPALVSLSLAALIHRYSTEEMQDDAPVLAAFRTLAGTGDPRTLVRAALAEPLLWGGAPPEAPGLPEAVAAAFLDIRALGMAAALQRALARTPVPEGSRP